jgi:hypothetical protein
MAHKASLTPAGRAWQHASFPAAASGKSDRYGQESAGDDHGHPCCGVAGECLFYVASSNPNSSAAASFQSGWSLAQGGDRPAEDPL